MVSTTTTILALLFAVSNPPATTIKSGKQTILVPAGSITIAGISLTKGAARSEVIDQLSPNYTLERMQSDEPSDNWLVRERSHPDHLAGTVSFEGGRLAKATRFCALSRDEEAVDATGKLFEVIERLVKEHGERPTVTVSSFQQDNVSVRQAKIVFGVKSVSIYVLEHRDAAGAKSSEVHVEEVLK